VNTERCHPHFNAGQHPNHGVSAARHQRARHRHP
jgi:hypothetical protein